MFPTKPSTKRDLHFYDMGAEAQTKIFEKTYPPMYVGNKKYNTVDQMMEDQYSEKGYKGWDEIGVDNDPGIDVPIHAKGGKWHWNFEKKNDYPMALGIALLVLATVIFLMYAAAGDQNALNDGIIH